jgi:hypothetical protein
VFVCVSAHITGKKGGRYWDRSEAYHSLSALARALLFELIDRYNGCNNGLIVLGVREAAYPSKRPPRNDGQWAVQPRSSRISG